MIETSEDTRTDRKERQIFAGLMLEHLKVFLFNRRAPILSVEPRLVDNSSH